MIIIVKELRNVIITKLYEFLNIYKNYHKLVFNETKSKLYYELCKL